jgi:hypothetical protein
MRVDPSHVGVDEGVRDDVRVSIGNANGAKRDLRKRGEPVDGNADRRLGYRHRIPPSTVICWPVM